MRAFLQALLVGIPDRRHHRHRVGRGYLVSRNASNMLVCPKDN